MPAVMEAGARRLDWNTADLARIGSSPEIWEVSTFWDGPDGITMATLERLTDGGIETAIAPVADLRRVT